MIQNSIKAFQISWREWWRSLSRFRKLLPAISVFVFWVGMYFVGGFRTDHLLLGLLILALGYGGKSTNEWLKFLLPLILTAIVYDTQRYYSDLIRGRIRVEEPYWFDKHFFGIQTPDGILTPNEWLQKHTVPILDFFTGLAYLTFIGVFVIQSAYFKFWLKIPKAEQAMWAFFWLNVIGYSTYYWYPAAPPWYVALYGLGPPRMDTLPNPAGCLRFDQLLGTHFFTGMYGRSADVFGAIPSLHIAYPLLSVFYSFRWRHCRIWSVFFYLWMCFSAVYLNHHYVLDLIWGSAYAVMVIFVSIRFFYPKRDSSLVA